MQAFFETGSLSELQRKLLVERHLISPALIVRANQCGVIVGDDGHLSAMVNEEDHLRLQGIFPGLQPREAWKAAHGLERIFADQLDFAFSDAWGYLTACPTNTGMGARVGVDSFAGLGAYSRCRCSGAGHYADGVCGAGFFWRG